MLAFWTTAKSGLSALANPWVLVIVAAVLGLGGTGWYRMQYLGEVAARTADVEAAQAKVIKAAQVDAARTREIEDDHAAEVAHLKDQLNARNLGIANTISTAACADSPAFRSLGDSLRQRQNNASPLK